MLSVAVYMLQAEIGHYARDHMVCKAWNSYSRALYRKSLPAPALGDLISIKVELPQQSLSPTHFR